VKVSVIVPCYNGEAYVAACLEALLAQTYPRGSYEVILVDNGSTDRTGEIARRYPVRVVVEAEKRGAYAARNAGVRVATGSILAFTDSDCEGCSTWIERVAAVLEAPGVSIVLGARRFASESLILRMLADYEVEKARYVFSRDDVSVYYAYTNNMAVRREVYEQAGPFVELQRGADVVFMSRAVAAFGCSAVRFSPDLVVRHLEIDRWYSWHRKMFIYGRSYSGYHRISHTRPLQYASRFEILRRTAKQHGYGLLRRNLMLASGVMATVAYGVGKAVGGRAAPPE
jgi:glycosyltransferase involved in cell wall biosynthesis